MVVHAVLNYMIWHIQQPLHVDGLIQPALLHGVLSYVTDGSSAVDVDGIYDV